MGIFALVLMGLLFMGSLVGRSIPEDSPLAWIILIGLIIISLLYPATEVMIWFEGRKKR